MKYVSVSFQERSGGFGEKEYHFLNCKELKLEVDDIVCVETKYGLQVVQVKGFTNTSAFDGIHRQVVDKIDMSGFEERKAREQRKNELRKEIEKRMTQVEWKQKVNFAATESGDNTLKELMEEYERM